MSPARPPARPGRQSGLRRRIDSGPAVVTALAAEAVAAAGLLVAGIQRGDHGPIGLARSSLASVDRHQYRETGHWAVYLAALGALAVVLLVAAAVSAGQRAAPRSGTAKARKDAPAPPPARRALALGSLAVAYVAQPLALAGAVLVVYEAATGTPTSPIPAWSEALALLAGLLALFGTFLSGRFLRSRALRPGPAVLGVAAVVVLAGGVAAVAAGGDGHLQHGFWAEAAPTATGWSDVAEAVSCPQACDVIASSSAVPSGSHWSVASGPSPWRVLHTGTTPPGSGLVATTGNPDSLACPTPTVCMAWASGSNPTARYWRSTDGGRTWRAGHLPLPTADTVMEVSCPAGADCFASDGPNVFVSTDDGASWDPSPVLHVPLAEPKPGHEPGLPVLYGLSCAPVTTLTTTAPAPGGTPAPGCGVVGASAGSALAYRSADGGRHWVSTSVPDDLVAMAFPACPGGGVCVAMAGVERSSAAASTPSEVLMASRDGGAWQQVGPVTGIIAAENLTCWSADACLAVGTTEATGTQAGAAIVRTTDGGTSWSTVLTVTGGSLVDVACTTARSCLATGSVPGRGAVIEQTHDGGTTWTAVRFPRS